MRLRNQNTNCISRLELEVQTTPQIKQIRRRFLPIFGCTLLLPSEDCKRELDKGQLTFFEVVSWLLQVGQATLGWGWVPSPQETSHSLSGSCYLPCLARLCLGALPRRCFGGAKENLRIFLVMKSPAGSLSSLKY